MSQPSQANFVRRLLECASQHELDNDWMQLDCCSRWSARAELKRIIPHLCGRVRKWHDPADWQRLTSACRFIARDEI